MSDVYKEESDEEGTQKSQRNKEISNSVSKINYQKEDDFENISQLIDSIPFYVNNITTNTNLVEAIDKLYEYTANPAFEVTSTINSYDLLQALCNNN